jgi:RNA polymerase sigma-70 factor (ECF subfamily)
MTADPGNRIGVADRLAAARAGNADEFARLAEPHRRELLAHCYRILGSFHEAEDLVQETFLRAWQRLETYQGRASFRAWLYKIATNACLDALDRAHSRRLLPAYLLPAAHPEAAVLPPRPDLHWLEPFPDQLAEITQNPEARYSAKESVSLAFLVALQLLPPRQRAVLILMDVLDWPACDVADLLGVTLSTANSALHRARVSLARRYTRPDPDKLDFNPKNEHNAGLLARYIQAWETADLAGLVALLHEDATLMMPPSPSWYRGRSSIAAFVAATVFSDAGMFTGQAAGRWRLHPTAANAQPAFGIYQRLESGAYRPFGIHVLEGQAGK